MRARSLGGTPVIYTKKETCDKHQGFFPRLGGKRMGVKVMGIKEIEKAIIQLPAKVLDKLAGWLENYRAQMWDKQVEEAPQRLPIALFVSILLLSSWLFLCKSSMASGPLTTYHYVAADGDCGTHTPCYTTLQAAVDAADDGDELLVAAGDYTGVNDLNGTSQLVYLAKSLTIRGGYHPQTWERDPALNPTILNAQGQGHVLFVTGAITPTIDGFHMTNGSAGNGGGVYVVTATVTLSHNEIYSNWAEGRGGGVYLKNSAAVIANNHIYTNTVGAAGRGGGLALADSPATVDGNLIEDNSAFVGGGVEMNNNLGENGALLTGNTIRNNVTVSFEQDGHTFASAGGGIDTHSYLTDTLRDNVISGNFAKWGGGVHAFGASVIIAGNTIRENNAPTHGGGLYVQGGQIVVLESNDILSNTAGSWGGGLTLLANTATILDNTFQGNTAGWRGGGMYASSGAQFDGNLFLNNTATEQGGGAFLLEDNGAIYQNSVFAGNQAAEGGGLYIWSGNASLIHSTITDNTSGDGRAVVIDKYPGLVLPGEPTISTATIVFTNAIVTGQPVGFFVTPDNRLTLDGVLWWATPTHIQADGVDLTVLNEHTGDPIFQADGYHLRADSAARDKGAAALDHDVDGHLREAGDQKDLGADEYVPMAVIDPETGGALTYIDPQEEITITLDVPPGAISDLMGLMFSPFPPLPPDVMDTPLGKFVAFGPPFRLDPFTLDPSTPVPDPLDPPLGDPSEPLIFGYPAHVALEYGVEKAQKMREAMDSLQLQLLAFLDGELLGPPLDAACGFVDHDLDARTMDVPICDTGIVSTTYPLATRLPVSLMALDPESMPGVFIFVVEVADKNVYLPLVMR